MRPFSVEVAAVAESRSGLKTIVLTVEGVSYEINLLGDLEHIARTDLNESLMGTAV